MPMVLYTLLYWSKGLMSKSRRSQAAKLNVLKAARLRVPQGRKTQHEREASRLDASQEHD